MPRPPLLPTPLPARVPAVAKYRDLAPQLYPRTPRDRGPCRPPRSHTALLRAIPCPTSTALACQLRHRPVVHSSSSIRGAATPAVAVEPAEETVPTRHAATSCRPNPNLPVRCSGRRLHSSISLHLYATVSLLRVTRIMGRRCPSTPTPVLLRRSCTLTRSTCWRHRRDTVCLSCPPSVAFTHLSFRRLA